MARIINQPLGYRVTVSSGTDATDETVKLESPANEFQRFKSPTAKLLKVSKDELDEKLGKSS
jgi:hypothetical protein